MNEGLFISRRNKGSSLIELLIASGMSCSVLFAAISALQTANAMFSRQEQQAMLLENGNYALAQIAQSLKQTAYLDYDEPSSNRYHPPENGSLWGADARNVKSGEFDQATLDVNSVNGSDVLVIRFRGDGVNVMNCAGFIVDRTDNSSGDRGWSIFYVAKSSLGEPELRCKYKGNTDWDSQAIISGVESFQVLYGLDTDGDGLINQYLNAHAIDILDAQAGSTESHWKAVIAVRIGLLLCSAENNHTNESSQSFDLFGADYTNAHGSSDTGTHIKRSNFPPDRRRLYRQVVQSIIYLPHVLRPL